MLDWGKSRIMGHIGACISLTLISGSISTPQSLKGEIQTRRKVLRNFPRVLSAQWHLTRATWRLWMLMLQPSAECAKSPSSWTVFLTLLHALSLVAVYISVLTLCVWDFTLRVQLKERPSEQATDAPGIVTIRKH